MIQRQEVAQLEANIGNLHAMYSEMKELATKKPNDGVNKFKIGMINQLIGEMNELLGESYAPLKGFTGFDADDLPTNSDVTFVLAQYEEQLERYRADNIKLAQFNRRIYDITDTGEEIRTAPPAKLVK